MMMILPSFLNCKSLKKIDFSINKLTSPFEKLLKRFLKACLENGIVLSEINLSSNRLNDLFVTEVLPELYEINSVLRLYFSNNEFQTHALKSLYQLLKENNQILMLDVRKNPGMNKKLSSLFGNQLEDNFNKFRKMNESIKSIKNACETEKSNLQLKNDFEVNGSEKAPLFNTTRQKPTNIQKKDFLDEKSQKAEICSSQKNEILEIRQKEQFLLEKVSSRLRFSPSKITILSTSKRKQESNKSKEHINSNRCTVNSNSRLSPETMPFDHRCRKPIESKVKPGKITSDWIDQSNPESFIGNMNLSSKCSNCHIFMTKLKILEAENLKLKKKLNNISSINQNNFQSCSIKRLFHQSSHKRVG